MFRTSSVMTTPIEAACQHRRGLPHFHPPSVYVQLTPRWMLPPRFHVTCVIPLVVVSTSDASVAVWLPARASAKDTPATHQPKHCCARYGCVPIVVLGPRCEGTPLFLHWCGSPIACTLHVPHHPPVPVTLYAKVVVRTPLTLAIHPPMPVSLDVERLVHTPSLWTLHSSKPVSINVEGLRSYSLTLSRSLVLVR